MPHWLRPHVGQSGNQACERTDKRRGHGEDSIYFDHRVGTECLDARLHRRCVGRWRGVVSLGMAQARVSSAVRAGDAGAVNPIPRCWAGVREFWRESPRSSEESASATKPVVVLG